MVDISEFEYLCVCFLQKGLLSEERQHNRIQKSRRKAAEGEKRREVEDLDLKRVIPFH